ncbi:MAG TPA: CHAT domain-containing tetratricopeptide repeat protein [Roseiflexaceae bacterium]|nr:CHAT domain-containing tetratricopeptide repeat protein [Roseiflexaceae bacterium]
MTERESLTQALERLRNARGDARDATERQYMRLQEQHFEEQIRRDPRALEEAAEKAPLELLHLPHHRQRLRYYRAAGAGQNDRFHHALEQLDTLLDEPDLEPETRGRTLNAAGLFARRSGNYERARQSYQESIQLWKELGNQLRQGLARNNLGALHYELRDYAEAERCFRQALELFTAAGSAYHQAQAYNELGLLCRDRGQWPQAQDYLDQAAVLCEREDAPELLARIINNQGEVAMLCGRYDEALALFERAQAGMTTQVYKIDIHINRGLIAQARGDDAAALTSYQVALDLAHAIGRAELTPLLHERIGNAQLRMGDVEAAMQSHTKAADEVEERRSPLRDEGLLIELMGRWQQIFEAAMSLCLERGDAAGAFDYAERARARAFADMLARNRTDLPGGQIAPVTLAEAQTALAPGDLLLVYFATGLRGPETELLDKMPAQAAAMRGCLTPPARLIALAVTHDRIAYADCPPNPNNLQATSSLGADGRRFLKPRALRSLDDMLLAPFAGALASAKRVIIVPHGPLHQVPFAALTDGAGSTLLERAARVQFIPSATALLRVLHTRRGEPQLPCLALGYDSPELGLQHCVAEAQDVARILGGVAIDGARIAAALPEQASECRVLHLACHGEFDLDKPLCSWLEIAPNTPLRAEAVLADYRLQADLVTLSACRSGFSKVLRGDEPMGLARAFLIAGARAVLVTLWPVDDQAARLLMGHFYQRMAQGQDAAAALRSAQCYLRGYSGSAETPPPYASPEHWAGYVLIGAP